MRFGYARVSTREQNPDHQFDALVADGIEPENIYIDKMSGRNATRPKLKKLLGKLREGDSVTVTRLRRLGRSHDDLTTLVARFNADKVDFVVLEQGIDTTTPIGRLAFHIFAAMTEYDRELIVEGTLDGLESARARGRTGGRPAKLTQKQFETAQQLYDAGDHTVEEIADLFNIARSTMYRYLSPGAGDCAYVVYRGGSVKIDDETNRRYGELAANESEQLEADRKYWQISATRRPRLKAVVFVAEGIVTRVRGIDPDGEWKYDSRGYADVPMTAPLTNAEIDAQLPSLPMRVGDHVDRTRGKQREYVAL